MPFKSLKSIILQIAFGNVIDFFLNVILLKKCDLTLIEIIIKKNYGQALKTGFYKFSHDMI